MSASFNILTQKQQTYLYHSAFIDSDDLICLFEPEKNLDKVVVEGIAGGGKLGAGRGNTYFLKFKDQQLVLRHYCRGGFVAKLSYDLYLWQGLKKTRAYREFDLLQQLQRLNLPVPEACAARIYRRGLFYQADLITVRLKQAQSLAERCLSANMTDTDWSAVGDLIRHFHDKQVYHADLNAHNILFNENQWYLIDFDKCEIKSDSQSSEWKLGNMHRLQRSLEKLREHQHIQFTEHEWQCLLSAYNRH